MRRLWIRIPSTEWLLNSSILASNGREDISDTFGRGSTLWTEERPIEDIIEPAIDETNIGRHKECRETSIKSITESFKNVLISDKLPHSHFNASSKKMYIFGPRKLSPSIVHIIIEVIDFVAFTTTPKNVKEGGKEQQELYASNDTRSEGNRSHVLNYCCSYFRTKSRVI